MTSQKDTPRRPRDANQLARMIVDIATGAANEPAPAENPTRTPEQEAAALLGRSGGLKGGKARAAKMTAEERRRVASDAAKARWSKTKTKEPKPKQEQ